MSVAISVFFFPLNVCLHRDFVVAHGLSLVAESRSRSSCGGGLFVAVASLAKHRP